MYFVNSMIVFVISWFVLLLALSATWMDVNGAIVSFPIMYLGLTFLIASSVIYQSRFFETKEIIVWVIINVIYIAVGFAFFFIKSSETEKQQQAVFITCYILFVPTFLHGLVVALRLENRGIDEFGPTFKAFAVVFVLGSLAIIACTFIFVNWVAGVILIGALVVAIYAVAQVYLYIKNDFMMVPLWEKVNQAVCLVLVIFATIYSIFVDNFSSF